MPDGVVVMDDLGTATFGNNMAESITDVPCSEIRNNKPEHWCDEINYASFSVYDQMAG
jgi:PAS domain-containing protein